MRILVFCGVALALAAGAARAEPKTITVENCAKV
jgi:hypothetical protein